MAGSVQISSSVFQLNFSAKLNVSAPKSATTQSRQTLAETFEKLGEFNNLMQQMINFIFVELWKNYAGD